jgi:probable HAF family extracellular repeat protein
LTYGHAINDSGQFAGGFDFISESGGHGVLWTGTAQGSLTPIDLGTLPGGHKSQACGINASGQVVGESDTVDGRPHAVLWTGSSITDLRTLGGPTSRANSINAFGQIAGFADVKEHSMHAVRWTGKKAIDLGTLGGENSIGYAINASGEVTGMSQIGSGGLEHAFLYTGGKMYDLNALLVPDSGVADLTITAGNGINDRGQIAATGQIDGHKHAVRLDPIP